MVLMLLQLQTSFRTKIVYCDISATFSLKNIFGAMAPPSVGNLKFIV